MVFSDTTDIENGHIQACEDHCGLYSGEISSDSTLLAQFTRRLNARQGMAQSIILDASPDIDLDDHNYGDRPSGTFPLTTARAFEIPVSERFLKIKRIEITYDGSTYYRASRIDSSDLDIALANTSKADEKFSTSNPVYDLEGNAVLVYPAATSAQVAAGAAAYIEWTREFEPFSKTGDDAKESGLDRNFQPYLDIGASYDWLTSYKSDSRAIPGLARELERYEALMRSHYSEKNLDTPKNIDTLIGLDDYS